MLLIGIEALALTAREREYLKHPSVAGVVLFARNFSDKSQLRELCADIRASAPRPQLLCVDQEGGRVQRFREGFARLPCLQDIGALLGSDKPAALALARQHAFLMASEIIASGLDLSFAPVADLGLGNLAIGNRAFTANPALVAECIVAYTEGMHLAGMAATLKHFPGHGSVLEDTHFDTAIDDRSYQQMAATDLLPFRAGLHAGAEAVMMAHVVYPQVAPDPAGFSRYWIDSILRNQFGFNGVVFSDDIGMAAAAAGGGIKARIQRHLAAGCDVVLACPPDCVADALEAMPEFGYDVSKLDGLRAKSPPGWDRLSTEKSYLAALQAVHDLEKT